jgi:hypothetical protein
MTAVRRRLDVEGDMKSKHTLNLSFLPLKVEASKAAHPKRLLGELMGSCRERPSR